MHITVKKILIFLMFITLFRIYSIDFKFKYNDGENYRIVSEVFENIKENDQYIFSTEILNRIAVNINHSTEESGEISAVYQISERESGGSGYHWSNEDSATFRRDNRGLYSLIPENESLPSVRNIPRFPERDLNPGDTWTFFAEEVHDLYPFFLIDHRLHIPFRVFYTYESSFEENGTVYDRILINYNIYYEEDPIATLYEHPDWGEIFPEKIVGSFHQEYIWNRAIGRPDRVEDRFEYKYFLSTGDTYTFSGVSYGEVLTSEYMDREKIADEINEELQEQGLENILAVPDVDGVKITIEDIRFVPDSPVLEESEILKLEKISEILKRLGDRDILISGHTARFGTEESSQVLSEERAAAVASYLLENGIREESEIVTRGYGSLKPIGNNSTIEGQKMNRRVEITILEN